MNANIKKIHALTPVPPMGWNSYNCYGCAASEKTLLENLNVMAVRLKPYGYTYFVVDNGWFGEYEIDEGKNYPTVKHALDVNIDEFGRYLPSRCYFPNGLKPIIDQTHALGLKFGIHLMRGISKKAVALNLPVKGTCFRASEIANPDDTCKWCHYNYGVDMNKPGAQEFYDSIVSLLAGWDVDFIKADDITGHPAEIQALARAIQNSGRDMVLSLSPGGQTCPENMQTYWMANMLRTTADIWDNRSDLDKAFNAWGKYQDAGMAGFWTDLDMIPFGHLQIWNPRNGTGVTVDAENTELSGKGQERMSGLTTNQKYTFITIRALAASPLFMGGDLPSSDEFSFDLITNTEMIACNQNGVTGHRIYQKDGIEVWLTPERKSDKKGWIGIFNRTERPQKVRMELHNIFKNSSCRFKYYDIWSSRWLNSLGEYIEEIIGEDGVLFLKYTPVNV